MCPRRSRICYGTGNTMSRVRTVLPVTASDEEVFNHACSQGLILISCNRDHFLTPARRTHDHPGLTILTHATTRQSECAHLLVLLQRAGESGLRNNVNFA